MPQHTPVKYLDIHLNSRLTWKYHIDAKLPQMKLKAVQINRLIGRNSVLSRDCKLLLYKSILKPIWSHGIHLWGTASTSNIEKIQSRQNKILRIITAAPWYIKNSNFHKVSTSHWCASEISKYVIKYLKKLEIHPNLLTRNILQHCGHTRLRRRDTIELRWFVHNYALYYFFILTLENSTFCLALAGHQLRFEHLLTDWDNKKQSIN